MWDKIGSWLAKAVVWVYQHPDKVQDAIDKAVAAKQKVKDELAKLKDEFKG